MLLQEQPPPLTRSQIWILAFVIFVISLLAALMMWTGSGRPRPPRQQNQQSGVQLLQDYGSFSIVGLGITAVFLGFLVMLLFADRFGDLASALGFLTALFGAVTGLVGTYFGIKSSSDAREGAQRLAASPPGGDTTPPTVTSTSPVDGAVNVSPDIHPTVTFTKDMDSATITPDTFKLLDQDSSAQVQPATGGVVYDSPTRTATFTPANPLGSGRTYAATITTAVRDRAGNTLAQDYTWQFTVS